MNNYPFSNLDKSLLLFGWLSYGVVACRTRQCRLHILTGQCEQDSLKKLIASSLVTNMLISTLCFTTNAALTTLADLVPQNISVNPNPATAGGNVTVGYTVANTGDTAAPA